MLDGNHSEAYWRENLLNVPAGILQRLVNCVYRTKRPPLKRGSFTEGDKRSSIVDLDPAAKFHGFHDPGDCNHISSITHENFLR